MCFTIYLYGKRTGQLRRERKLAVKLQSAAHWRLGTFVVNVHLSTSHTFQVCPPSDCLFFHLPCISNYSARTVMLNKEGQYWFMSFCPQWPGHLSFCQLVDDTLDLLKSNLRDVTQGIFQIFCPDVAFLMISLPFFYTVFSVIQLTSMCWSLLMGYITVINYLIDSQLA